MIPVWMKKSAIAQHAQSIKRLCKGIRNEPIDMGVTTMRSTTFAVIGGDLRQVHLAGLLSADEYNVLTVGFDRDVEISSDILRLKSASEAVMKSDCVILPLPFTADGVTVNAPFARAPIPLEEIWKAARKSQIVAGGRFTQGVYDAAGSIGFRPVDYYEREELAILNTIPTAEGAIQIAMEELPITVHNARCLVTGFGKVAKMLSHDLYALGADVTCCARKYADLAWMKALGYHPLHFSSLPRLIGNFDVIFNTVPAMILNEDLLSRVDKNCLVIDLASKPGGVDFETAGRLGLKTFWALSLPGKVAPITSGAMIKDTILNILDE